MRKLVIFFFAAFSLLLNNCGYSQGKNVWSFEKANKWYLQHKWIVGCNFIPSTAENTLEMWQNDNFDPVTIDRELALAQSIGFNSIRVFLHYLVRQQDPVGFKKRLNKFLDIASKNKITTMFVLFDDCWNGYPKLGKQPAPIPGVHNSRWVQCPGQREVTYKPLFPVFKKYVMDIISSFKRDKRIIMWDLYNEPGGSKHGTETLPLLKNVFRWARGTNPTQPLAAGIWKAISNYSALNNFQLENSDIITFHNYKDVKNMKLMIDSLKKYHRPLICTEYVCRPTSTFEKNLPLLRKERIGAYN